MKSDGGEAAILRPPPVPLLESRRVLTLLLLGMFLWSATLVDWGAGMVHGGGLGAAFRIVSAMFRPVLTLEVLWIALVSAWRTVAYAFAGLSLALVIGFPLGVLASGTVAETRIGRVIGIGAVRFLLAFFRSIHELVWAWLLVAALGFSPLAAVLALGIPYGGILGRIYAELLQDVAEEPLRALRSTGASNWKVFWYGRLPMAFQDMLSYTFYRLECGIRSAAILGWVGLGGLGFNIQVSLADLAFERAWTFIWVLIALVAAIDLWSTQIRRRLVG